MNQHKELLALLNECAEACNHCYYSCLNEQNVAMKVRCIELDRECADICQWTASVLARNSDHASNVLHVCAEICKACSEECSRHKEDHCVYCAEICRKCGEACTKEISVTA